MSHLLNERLKELYKSHWDNLSKSLNQIITDNSFKIKPSNPLLLKHANPRTYETADIRVLIIGQETNCWEGVFYNDLNKISDVYCDFFRGYKYNYRGYFHNHFNHFIKLLENKYPNKSISVFWNNVIKVGKSNDKNIPPDYIIDVIKKDFSVLNYEIEIIKPNLILFFSGPDYDKYIFEQIHIFEKKTIEGFFLNELLSFHIKNVDYSFRTYHPYKMNFLGKNKYEKIYNEILSKLTF